MYTHKHTHTHTHIHTHTDRHIHTHTVTHRHRHRHIHTLGTSCAVCCQWPNRWQVQRRSRVSTGPASLGCWARRSVASGRSTLTPMMSTQPMLPLTTRSLSLETTLVLSNSSASLVSRKVSRMLELFASDSYSTIEELTESKDWLCERTCVLKAC